MLIQIWSACTDIIFCHFRSFFALMPHYWSWKLKFGKTVKKHQEILSFYTHVPLIKIICTLDMMYGSWDMKFNRQNYFVILGHFCPLPSNILKNENIKNGKTPRDKCTKKSYTSVPKNHDHLLYCSRDVARDRCNFYSSFWAIFSLLLP